MIRQACSLHGPTGLRDLGRMFCLYDDVSLYRYTYWVVKTAVANAVITSYDCDATEIRPPRDFPLNALKSRSGRV